MDKGPRHSAHCVYVINYHLVWIPRYRKGILVGPIAERLQVLLREIADQYGFGLLAQEVMSDHMHVFATAPPKFLPRRSCECSKASPRGARGTLSS
jgi:putative transposase